MIDKEILDAVLPLPTLDELKEQDRQIVLLYAAAS